VKGTVSEVVQFYQQLGFETVGRCSLAKALIANGEGDMLPEDYRMQERFVGGVDMLWSRGLLEFRDRFIRQLFNERIASMDCHRPGKE
jgi:hypothetical protein